LLDLIFFRFLSGVWTVRMPLHSAQCEFYSRTFAFGLFRDQRNQQSLDLGKGDGSSCRGSKNCEQGIGMFGFHKLYAIKM